VTRARSAARRLPRALALIAAAAALACAHGLPAAPGAPALEVDAGSAELNANPGLRARLRATPHNYFRFVNAAFTREVCRRFAGLRTPQPDVTLHGDCHLEQYAVTDLGRGLTDFDDSATGPAYVDLVRFGVSIELALRQRSWGAEADRIAAAFRSGYRKALQNPAVEAPEPQFARRAAQGFDHEHARCVSRAEELMESLPAFEPEADEAKRELLHRMLAENAGLPSFFFRTKRIGRLRLGIGSAVSAKYLVRIEGPTESPDDDIIIEAKELVDRQGIDCVHVEPGPSRIFLGGARLAYQPFQYPGVIHVGNKTLWVHAWPDNYVEVAIATLRSAEELREIAYDVGVQLGRGHPKGPRVEDATRLRAALLRSLPEARIRSVVVELTEETLAAWQRFRASDAGR